MMLLTGANNKTYRHLMQHEPDFYGCLVQPRSYRRNKLPQNPQVQWALDNDAFNGFHSPRFLAALEYLQPYRDRCLFVVCPDSVGDHKQTLVQWWEWWGIIKRMGYPIAFVGQDGLVMNEVPWKQMDVFFVGGTDQFKDLESREVIKEAQRRGIWVHIGRVNDSESRLRYCLSLGVDSIDGSAYGFKPDKMLKWYHNQLTQWERQGRLL